jgi:hypothetical protein
MNTYSLTILDGTSKGYTTSVKCQRMEHSSSGYYVFFNVINGYQQPVGYYPINRTIINKIETDE